MATIRDVARVSGVSVTTVSFVLNNSPRPVSAETRRRVSEAARHLEYYPNAMARGLVQRRMNSIGILFSQIEPSVVTNNYANGILSGIFAESSGRGYDIHLYTGIWESAEISAPRFRSNQTDGTLVIGPLVGSDMVTGLDRLRIPVVVLSAPSGVSSVPYVDVDNSQGGILAAEHFLALGHERVGCLLGEIRQHAVLERRDAFTQTLARAGKPVRPEYIAGHSYALEDVEAAAYRLLTLPEPPTAIFASNDDIAMVTMRVANELGMKIPRDVSVIGFDDYPVAQQTAPPLTTLRQPLETIGRAATELLLARIDGKDAEAHTHLFQTELIVRGSTAPPNFVRS